MDPGGKQNFFVQKIDQPLKVGGFEINFKTMPRDMEALGLYRETVRQVEKMLPAEAATTKSVDAGKLYRESRSLYNRNFYQAAIEKLEKLLSADEQFQKAKEIARQKLLEQIQREEQRKAQLQEKLLRETKERELKEQQLAEELQRQKQLERQLEQQKQVVVKPPPLFLAPTAIPRPQGITIPSLRKQKAAHFSAKTIELLTAVFLIVIISSGIVYWLGWKKLHPSAPPAESPSTQSGEVLPVSLFPIDETLPISLQIGRKKTLSQELEKISGRNQASGTFMRILIKFISEDGTQNYASLGDLIDSLQIVFPPEILNSLDKNNYTLFLYAQKNLSSSPFALSLGKNKLGLMATITRQENLVQKFLFWEKTMPQDLDALFLGKKISFPTQRQFNDIPHREVLIRSFNLPDQSSSLNYTFYNNKIIIATSLEATKSLIDKIAP
ncbi:MAG: hypothetical protein HY813_01485 [Candidatus Portnoybacteria bacterium]|nr:hypothetical protein [Candidatus Portnoybacteria bacterium]